MSPLSLHCPHHIPTPSPLSLHRVLTMSLLSLHRVPTMSWLSPALHSVPPVLTPCSIPTTLAPCSHCPQYPPMSPLSHNSQRLTLLPGLKGTSHPAPRG